MVQPYIAPRTPLLPELVEPETLGKRLLFSALAVAIAMGFLALSLCYWAPAHPGIDQNAYLVGGRMLAEHRSIEFSPNEPYAFVGAMWIGIGLDTARPTYFPKYPIGLPLLNAMCLKGGPAWASLKPHIVDLPILRSTALWMARPDGTTLAYLLSPIAMTASLWAMFLLGRLVGGSFGGLMAMLLLATSQVTLALVNNPNSHAVDLCVVAWGMYWLARWWQTDQLWRGLLAGLLLGGSVTIRYSEALLLIPLFIASAFLPWRRSWLVIVAWAIPVAALAWFNLHIIGHYTGYDPTHESGGFDWHFLQSKWEFVTQELYDNSIFFLPAIATVGLIAIFGRSRRWGLLLCSWFLPGALLCSLYYWGGNTFGAGYLRLYFSVFPPLILAGVWLTVNQARSVLAAGVVVAIAAAVGLHVALPSMERELASNLNLAYTINRIAERVPASGSMVIADQYSDLCVLDNALQFAGDFAIYTTDAFLPPAAKQVNDGFPSPDQAQRYEFYRRLFDGKSADDLLREAHRVIGDSLTAGHSVYAVLQPASSKAFRQTYLNKEFHTKLVDRWTEPAEVPTQTDARFLAPVSHGYVFTWVRNAQTFELWQVER